MSNVRNKKNSYLNVDGVKQQCTSGFNMTRTVTTDQRIDRKVLLKVSHIC